MSEVDEAAPELKHLECEAPESEVKEPPRSPEDYIDSPDPSEVTNDTQFKEEEEGEDTTNQVPQDGKPFASIEGELDFEDEAESSAVEKSVSGKKKQISEEIGVEVSKSHESEEEGLCTPEKKNNQTEKKDGSVEEGEDDGECTDDDQDLEEGELKEENNESTPKPAARQICKFYNRNQCFYGNVCRFLHLNFDHRGNYNMFATTPRNYSDGFESGPHVGSTMGPSNVSLGMMNHRTRSGPDFIPPPLPPPPPEPPMESAWERGLREAKELVKKANKRKEEEPDFEQKRLNLSLVVNEKVTDFERDKENDCLKNKKKKRHNEGHFKYDDPHDAYDNEYDSRTHSGGRYENFEIRYTDRSSDRGRPRMRRLSHERDKFPKFGRKDNRWRDDRLSEVQARSRPEESFFDPWRRSKSPKGNRRSRSRSFSSVSSYTYSSRSSYSYSNSSSRSSCSSSRSPSQQKRKISPIPETGVSPKTGAIKSTPLKKKPGAKRNSRTRSYSRSARRMLSLSRTSSSRSRSISRTPSISRSRSSRSISMDSVSSASSSVSHSSSGSGSLGRRNTHVSILRKQEEKSVSEQICPKPIPPNLFPEFPRINKFEKSHELPKLSGLDEERDPLEEKFQMTSDVPPFPSLQHLLPNVDKPKEPVKAKQQIKLTLLNKNPQNKLINTLPKKEIIDINKIKQPDEPSKMGIFNLGIKRPLSPPAVIPKPAPVIVPKKSPSSRRDELLKQLKAVEDAIARKRAKFC